MQQPSPQQNIPPMNVAQQQQQQPMEKTDNITKVKSLLPNLRESLKNVFNSAAYLLNQNNVICNGKQQAIPTPSPRFDKHLEEFFSICDQFELHLITAKKCIQQNAFASVYLPVPVQVNSCRGPNDAGMPEQSLSYLQFMELVHTQITYAKDVHDTLVMAAQNM